MVCAFAGGCSGDRDGRLRARVKGCRVQRIMNERYFQFPLCVLSFESDPGGSGPISLHFHASRLEKNGGRNSARKSRSFDGQFRQIGTDAAVVSTERKRSTSRSSPVL